MVDAFSQFPRFPKVAEDEYFYISQEGLENLAKIYDKNDPFKHVLWTNDYRLEIPIKMKKTGLGSIPPQTVIECYEETLKKFADQPSLSQKKNGKWQTLTHQQVYNESKDFGKALIALGISQRRAINIIGYNSPEWFISFYGSIFAFNMPVGIYTTNQAEACFYVCQHSDCELVVVENQTHLNKYLSIWDRLPLLKAIVIYNDKKPDNLPADIRNKVLLWSEFMQLGKNFKAQNQEDQIEFRMRQVKPGNCCTIVYTSGTTGPPKGAMLSHDNYIWCTKSGMKYVKFQNQNRMALISYLPLSHSASQIQDIFANLVLGAHVYFADATALQGSLINFLKEIRPTYFFSVPRVWEKIEEGMKAQGQTIPWLNKKIATWARSIGAQGTFNQAHGKSLPFGWSIADKLFYSKVKKNLGLDQASSLVFGAAPMSPQTRDFFMSLNLILLNGYGMTENAGPETVSQISNFDKYDKHYLSATGTAFEGTQMVIYNPDKDGNGEICYDGRNRFMGYYKLEDETRKTIDKFGFLHTGDTGKLDQRGNLTVTGRIKELIVTAGGENVAPVLIENVIKEELNIISNSMVIGDMKKYLIALLTLRHDNKLNAIEKGILAPDIIKYFQSLGSSAKTTQEARNCPKITAAINEGMKRVNQKAISQAQKIQRWYILDGDFTIDGGELTPTQKLKRKETEKKYKAQIDSLYVDSKL